MLTAASTEGLVGTEDGTTEGLSMDDAVGTKL